VNQALRIIAYTRVSTQEQADEGVSLEAQRLRLEAYCTAHGWPVPELVVDAGVSAKSLDRPGLGYVLAEVKRKRVDVLLVLKLDRLTRSVADLSPLVKTLERGGCQLVSLGESLDTTTAAGRLMLNLLVSVSQWEREAIAERTSTALRHMRDSGKAYNHTPLGFRRQGDKLLEDAPEMDTARRIVALKREGLSMNKIARVFNEEDVPSKLGGRWYASTVKRVLDRAEVYTLESSV
jgi:site-specific DNA recombinase